MEKEPSDSRRPIINPDTITSLATTCIKVVFPEPAMPRTMMQVGFSSSVREARAHWLGED